ncbi:MAG: hypothetical protein K2J72_06315 [Oscillospiraceae bacterium]|nr:hypothetical protein [Oscillospiraceae bacterium]
METKIGTRIQIRSSFSGGKGGSVRRNADTNSAKAQSANVDTFTRSMPSSSDKEEVYLSGMDISDEMRDFLKKIPELKDNIVRIDPSNFIAKGGYEGITKSNFDLINFFENNVNQSLTKKLEAAGVPKDVTFEFDYNFDSKETELTNVSDEEYRENIESILKNTGSKDIFAYASRIMNGYISSMFYPRVENSLKDCFEQDIADLYIDENGDIGGANENLQAALDAVKEAEKTGEDFSSKHEFGFPTDNIEGIIKRLISDENITPNVSHMGYDGEQIYTNDGEFKFGKDFDPNLFGEEKYVMRGSMSLYILARGYYDRWLENEEKFY